MIVSALLSITAASGAAVLAYVTNRLSRTRGGGRTVVLVAPGLEESFKTGAALVVGAPVLATHVAFGWLEALYDLFAGRRSGSRAGPGRRAAAALCSLVGHALFGAVTCAVHAATGHWPAGVAAAYLLHMGWNALVMGRVGAGS